MTNDKDSAVLADQTLATAYRDWRLSTTASPIHYKPMALAFVAGWKAALRQPTQSDALREALETARDYVADVAVGNIHFNDNIKAMAAEDLTRIDAALQEQSKCP